MSDKRKSLMRVLMDKRPVQNYECLTPSQMLTPAIKNNSTPKKNGDIYARLAAQRSSKVLPSLRLLNGGSFDEKVAMFDSPRLSKHVQHRDSSDLDPVAAYQRVAYMEAAEQAAQYPRLPKTHSTVTYHEREPKQFRLIEIYESHKHKFDAAYKQKLFQYGEDVLRKEEAVKYDRVEGQAKINFYALSKKSKNKLLNAYFRNETNNDKMDNLIEKLKSHRVFSN